VLTEQLNQAIQPNIMHVPSQSQSLAIFSIL